MYSLPPMTALRAFEAAARLSSFSEAAAELHVTPGAISQQIKQLEHTLDIDLFIRRNRQVQLTEPGRLLYPQLNQAFEQIHQAIESVIQLDKNQPLTITAPPAFIAKWLIPRLDSFNTAHPEINVRIDASMRLIDFDHEDIDIGIRLSTELDPSLDSTHLMSLEIAPVCSPALLQSEPKLESPTQLKHFTLLHYEVGHGQQAWADWDMWLAAMDITGIDTNQGMYFTQPDMLIQAAIEGQGVALVVMEMAEYDIRRGRLVKPFDLSMPIRFSYYLVCAKHKAQRRNIQAFKQWIIEQAAADV